MSTSDDDMYAIMEVIKEETVENEIETFFDEQFAFHDDREDACTQTDAYAASKTISILLPSDLEVPQIGSEESISTDMCYDDCQFSSSPTTRRKTSQYNKDKTPNTVKLLKEKHRENERLRHHSLNQHLRLICKNVPGSAEDGKETKVVMMQRIISYVAYLENTLQFMSSELHMQPNPSWLMLTSSVKDIEKSGAWRNDYFGISSDESADSEIFKRNISRRLKLSSPTIDSTTDPSTSNVTPNVRSQIRDRDFLQDSEDSSFPTSSLYLDMDDDTSKGCQEWLKPVEVVIDGPESFDGLLSVSDYDDQSMFELPSSTFENKLIKSPDEVKWLGSPDRSPSYFQERSDCHFGIKCDPAYLDEQPLDMSHTITVSPDQVLPQTAIKQEVVESKDDIVATSMSCSNQLFVENASSKTTTQTTDASYPVTISDSSQLNSRSKKRKQSSPRRVPLLNIANLAETPFKFSQELSSVGGWAHQGCTSSIDESEKCLKLKAGLIRADMITKEMAEENSIEIPGQDVSVKNEKVERDVSGEASAKLDLRKSSWMNGFMMFSQIHRKRFIRENPGLHTSTISKMMGHAWRGMSSKQQEPYRDKARICSQKLQSMLDGSCHE